MFSSRRYQNMMSASASRAEASFSCAGFAADTALLALIVDAIFVASIIILRGLSLSLVLGVSTVLVLVVLLVGHELNSGKRERPL